jgi:hypothetical protein
VAVVSDSRGLAGLITYPGGVRRWAINVGGANNPHSVEMLPNGNVAVAASTGGFIRLYAASQGTAATRYAQYSLPGAHGVLWDEAGFLWAIGDSVLVRLNVGGTAAAPALSLRSSFALPTPWGHDLAPKLNEPDRLFLTTNSRGYEFSKSANAIVVTYNLSGLKSLSTMGNQSLVYTQPTAGCRTTWCTDKVRITLPDEVFTITGAEIYKARVWSSRYI